MAPQVPCGIIPTHLLNHIRNNNANSNNTRAAALKTYNHICKLQASRTGTQAKSRGQSIIPSHVFKAIAESNHSSAEQKDRAQSHIESIASRDAHHSDARHKKGTGSTNHVYRSLYTSETTDTINKTLLFEEGADTKAQAVDTSAAEVYKFFGDTYQFYQEVFDRNSVDDKGLHLIGSVHYDDEPGPPGMDNAFWDGKEMAFGDGDGEIFGSFTKNIDVIGHELTHGVTQYDAALEYEYQSGALNESISDVFGSMIKQYFGPNGKEKAADADWLIGEGIFLPAITNAKALRSMKDPGTAYDNSKIGRDTQKPDMDGYQDMPNTADGDWGGVHTNSGIPNRAFCLASIALGGYSWDKAGKIWYSSLRDPALKGIDTKKAFTIFADLTCKYAASLFDAETASVVKKAWTDVKVYAGHDDL